MTERELTQKPLFAALTRGTPAHHPLSIVSRKTARLCVRFVPKARTVEAVVSRLRYEAPGWGVGEIVLEGEVVVASALPRPTLAAGPSADHPLADRLVRWFAGEPDELDDVPLAPVDQTPFSVELTRALATVPRGEVVTYGELAALAGRPGAARAAGTFCARCGLAPFVPVHRVVGASGLGGFGSLGLSYKRRLLELEGWPG